MEMRESSRKVSRSILVWIIGISIVVDQIGSLSLSGESSVQPNNNIAKEMDKCFFNDYLKLI
jgi:hypothetical protein